MKAQNTLDPPNGDYVQYIEKIQLGKVTVDEGLKVSGVKEARPIDPPKPPETTIHRVRSGNTILAKFFPPLLIIAGFIFLSCGIGLGLEVLIPIGMFVFFSGFITLSTRKK